MVQLGYANLSFFLLLGSSLNLENLCNCGAKPKFHKQTQNFFDQDMETKVRIQSNV